MDEQQKNSLKEKNARTIKLVLLTVVAMLGLSYASVPLYNVFCRVTGFGGTTQVSQALPEQVIDRNITIRFDTNTARNMPWNFYPEVKEVSVKLGAKGLANFIAYNPSKETVAGTAVFNVTPLKAGKYFNKIQCFCFNEQVLKPSEKVNMPVVFYVDPKMNDDPLLDDVTVITLSYSFFRMDTPELDKALDAFYNSGEDNQTQ